MVNVADGSPSQMSAASLAPTHHSSPPAGLFDHNSEAQKATFERSVEAVNDDRTILTKSLLTTDVS